MSDIEKVKQLRKSTGAGFKDCNAALLESNGDLDKAVEILRVKGISKASKKMSRVANEGVVALSGDESKLSVIEVNCETDFVAKNEDFINFVKELSELNNSNNSDLEKLNKTKMKNNKTVSDNLVALIAKIGEKITLGRAKTFNHNGSKNFNYLHTVVKDNLSKLAVIVSLETKDTSGELKNFGKQLSMHIAASNPLALDAESIDSKILEKEKSLINEELKNSGKPDNIIAKISLGKLNKFKEENSLLSQQWVMEPKKKVNDILKELSSLRTGRANSNMLDLIKVDVYGQKMPINQIGSITTPEARMINIQVWDQNNVSLIDSAIRKSDLGLNPQIDGQLIRLPIPDLSEERRSEMKKMIKSIGEKCKISIRNIRREANDNLKNLLKNKEISEDEEKKFQKLVQTFTDNHIKQIDDKVGAKEKEIMTI